MTNSLSTQARSISLLTEPPVVLSGNASTDGLGSIGVSWAGHRSPVGTGHDTFVFDQTTPGTIGAVTINHFDPNKDVIQIASALTEAVTPVDNHGNAVITVDASGDTITLTNVQASALHASNFHIV